MPTPLRYLMYILFFLLLSEHWNMASLAAALFAVALTRLFLTEPVQRRHFKWQTLPALTGLWVTFILILLREILLANLQVARIVLSPKLKIAPQVERYTTRLSRPALLTAFSTAITLTPGTMTIDIRDNTLQIHCLTDAYAQALDSNPVEPILLRIEEVLNG